MNKAEGDAILDEYEKLESECYRIGKLYLDYRESRGYDRPPNHTGTGAYKEPLREYYGMVSSVLIDRRSNSFTFTYHPSTSGIGGKIILSLDYVYNNGEGLQEKVDEDYRKRLEDIKRRTCDSCGHEKPKQQPIGVGMFSPQAFLNDNTL